MFRIIKYIFGALVVLGLVLIIWALYQLLAAPKNVGQYPTQFNIREGAGVHEISNNLYQGKLINNEFIWQTWVWYKNLGGSFIAGSHQIKRPLSGLELADLLTTKQTNQMKRLTFPEGWTARQMGQLLENNGLSQTEELLEVVGFPGVDYRTNKADPPLIDYSKQYSFLQDKPAWAGLEGYLFPDTYFVADPFTIKGLVEKMLDNFGRKIDANLRTEIIKQNKTIYEVLTLASIVEKEVATDQDRAMVADIFLKRLQKNIGLQSDATVNYLTGKNHLQPLIKDTQIDNPYNTYKYRGLPPGPINNPSLSAIMAVVYPTKNDYYYFLTTPDNKVIYSKTYEEHLKNKNKYLK